jgi:hypothetical protein
MKRLIPILVVALIVGLAGTAFAQVQNITQSTSSATIQAAINAAAAGDSIYIPDGTYAENLNIPAALTGLRIGGQSRAGSIIDISGGGSSTYGIGVAADGVSLRHFTLQGNGSGSSYGIHVSGGGYSTLLSVTIEDVTADQCKRTAIDINGGNGVVLKDVACTSTTSGAGIAFSDGKSVTLTDITTSGNPWGGVAFYNFGRYHTPGTNGVVVQGTCSFGENGGANGGLYLEEGNYNTPASPLPISYSTNILDGADVTILTPALTHALHSNQALDDLPYLYNRTRFYGSLAQAQSAAAGSPDHSTDGRFIEVLGGADLYVPWVAGGLGSIQSAVDFASSGDVIHVDPGHFEEQVAVDGKDIEIAGDGRTSTYIDSPVTLAETFNNGNSNKPVVTVTNCASTSIHDLTVDGLGRGNGNYRMVGVAFWNAGGALLDCDVTNIEETPFSGNQHGIGVYATNNTGGPYSLEVGGVNTTQTQKNGMALSGAGLTVNVHDCTTQGHGDTSITAENGIQVSSGAGGTVTDCTISDVRYTPATWTSSGLLLYANNPLTVSGVTIYGAQTPVYAQDGSADFSGMEITGGDWDAVFLYNSSASPKPGLRTLSQGTARQPVSAQPVLDTVDGGTVGVLGVASSLSTLTFTVDQSCFTGTDSVGTSAVDAYSEGGALNATVTNCTMSHYDETLFTYGPATTLTANSNSITSSLTAGYDNAYCGVAQDATGNWWGAADGPSGDGSGSGDAVLSVGGEVAFSPWLIDGTSSTVCAFTQGSNPVTPMPADSCLTGATPCNTVSFDIARSDNAGIRGFTITFQLSSELELCTGSLGDIAEGTYLNGVGTTAYQVLDNGGGSYTVDCAILGLPCGATATTGTLFTVNVKASGSASSEDTGTITVASVTFRDCDNHPVAADAGGSALLDIDTSSPAAISDLSASQVKTGNDGDGTTKIDLAWSAVTESDADVIEIYRAGYGAYPEYDDNGGSVPAAPGYSPSSPWSYVATVPASATSYTDEPSNRDFWYYVAFVKDLCGNVSPVSNETGGTLNYHLGDVSDGVTAGAGDDSVSTVDISLLGAHYGIALSSPTDTYGYLDVGPTTDYSVDARPTTDNQVQFEDLIMFAINYGQVSKPGMRPVETDPNAVTLAVPENPGGTFEVSIEASSNGRIQGMTVPLRWNAAVVKPIGFTEGAYAGRQGDRVLVLSPKAGTVDAAVFGSTFQGKGELATVQFHRIAAGDPGIGLGDVQARDGENKPVDLDVTDHGTPVVPTVTRLLPSAPNPFQAATGIRFALKETGPVQVKVYGLDGRLVRTLVDETLPAGERTVQWDGRDDAGREVASGSYMIRFVTRHASQTERVVRLR